MIMTIKLQYVDDVTKLSDLCYFGAHQFLLRLRVRFIIYCFIQLIALLISLFAAIIESIVNILDITITMLNA